MTCKNRFNILLCLLVALATSGVAMANNLSVKASIDSTVIWMGEQTLIHLELTQDAEQQVQQPLLSDTITAAIEIINVATPDTTKLSGNKLSIHQEVLVTSFDSGFYYIPPFRYVIDKDTFYTSSLSLKVLPVEVDTTQAGFDIKGTQQPRFVLTDYLPDGIYMWSTLLLLLLIAGGIYWWKKLQNREKVEIDPIELLPPHVRAIQALEATKAEKLWQSGREKEYYTRITDTLRLYLAQRYDINALELTTYETLQLVRKGVEDKEVYNYLKEVLELADFVKFAKMKPLADENEQSLRRAFSIVEITKEVEPEIEMEKVPEENPETPS